MTESESESEAVQPGETEETEPVEEADTGTEGANCKWSECRPL